MFGAKRKALIAVLSFSFLMLMFCCQVFGGESREINTDERVGIENGLVKLSLVKLAMRWLA